MAIYTIQLKRGKAASWQALDPILEPGEPGMEIDTGKLKIGDGVKSWKELQYVGEDGRGVVNAAPETLDTLGELAAAFEENKEVVEALDASITNKQDKISNTLILVDTVTGIQHKIQIQNGQLVSFPIE